MAHTLTVADPADLTAQEGIQFTIEAANGLSIDSAADLEVATDLLSQLKKAAAAIEAQRVSLTKPINDVVKALNAAAKATSSPIVQAEGRLRMVVNEFARAEQAARNAAEAEAKEQTGDKVVDPGLLPEQTTQVRGSTATGSFRGRWTMEVLDLAEFAKWCVEEPERVERFLTINGGEIRKALVPLHKDNIPGLRIFENVGVVVR